MILAWRDRDRGYSFVFGDSGRVGDENERWGMKMQMTWST